MRKVLTSILLMAVANGLVAQSSNEQKPFERHGFTFGLSAGAGTLTLSRNDTVNIAFATTLPNLRIGYMLNQKFAVQLLLPGSLYTHQGKARGFEGVLITGQYWVKDKWWVLGGAGMALDAPAFWTIKDPKDADFHVGFPALTFATGYEVLRKGNFTIDVQYRIYAGQANLGNGGKLQGVTNMFSVGFNWY